MSTLKEKIIHLKSFIPNDYKTFTKSTLIYLLIPLFGKLIKLISVPFETRILTIFEFGEISLFSSISSFMSIFLLLSLHSSVNRYYYEFNEKKEFQKYLGSVLLFLTIFDLFILIIVFWFRNYFTLINVNSFFIILAILNSILSKPFMFRQILRRLDEEPTKFVFYSFLKEFSSFIITMLILFFVSDNTVFYLILSMVLKEFIFSFFSVIDLIKLSKFSLKFPYLKLALSFSLPLIPFSLNGFILNTSDRLILNFYNGLESTGLYSFTAIIASILVVVTSAIDKAWLSTFYKNLRLKNFSFIESISDILILFVFTIGISIMFFSPEIIYFFSSVYLEVLYLVPLAVFSAFIIFLSNRYSYYLMYQKKTIQLSFNTLVASVLNIVLNFVFIPTYGYEAAIYTTAISYSVLLILNSISSFKNGYKIKGNLKLTFIYYQLFFIVTILLSFYYYLYGTLFLFLRIIIFILIIFIILAFINKKIKLIKPS
jgi:O-antigen/teichoic acid export membrane protein